MFHFLRLGRLTWYGNWLPPSCIGSSTTGCTNASSRLDEPHDCEFCTPSARTHNFCESSARTHDARDSSACFQKFCESSAGAHDFLLHFCESPGCTNDFCEFCNPSASYTCNFVNSAIRHLVHMTFVHLQLVRMTFAIFVNLELVRRKFATFVNMQLVRMTVVHLHLSRSYA